jgi:hypothetical protein
MTGEPSRLTELYWLPWNAGAEIFSLIIHCLHPPPYHPQQQQYEVLIYPSIQSSSISLKQTTLHIPIPISSRQPWSVVIFNPLLASRRYTVAYQQLLLCCYYCTVCHAERV